MLTTTERRELIELALKRFPPEQLLTHYDYSVQQRTRSRKGGYEYALPCPFHESSSINFSMNSATARWLCRSAFCGKAGDAVRFIALHEDCDDERALHLLFRFAGIPMPKVDQLSRTLSHLASAAVDESVKKSIETPQVQPWPVGYEILPHPYFVKKRGIPPKILRVAKAGRVKGAPFYRYRACIPVMMKGDLYSLYSRRIASEKAWIEKHPMKADKAQRFFPKHHYSGNSLTSHLLYGLEDVQGKTVILVEAILSVLKLRAFGVRNAVALLKARLSVEQLTLLMDHGFETIIICTDNDLKRSKDDPTKYINPGMKAAWDIYRKLKDYFSIGILQLPFNVDPAAMHSIDDFQPILDAPLWPQDLSGSPDKVLKSIEELWTK